MRGISTDHRLPNWLLGVILIVVVAIGSVIAYTKDLPFTDRFEVHAVFPSPQTIRAGAPVRIAGIEVGEVSDFELIGNTLEGESNAPRHAVRVTFQLSERARPLREDATFHVRPRLFIDGNYFVDLHPGSPGAAEVSDGHTFSLDQTMHSVQLDQVLSTLQRDVRTDVRVFLDQFGNALIHHQGAKGLREFFRTSPRANRYSAQVAESQLGTEPGDLRGTVDGLGRVFRGLSRNQQALSDLVTNLRRVSGAFAVENIALGQTIERLPGFLAEGEPTFAAINEALPSARAFAREALPGVRKSPEALRAGLPMLQQLRGLMSRAELRGLVARLRPTIPQLARLARSNVGLFGEQRAFSSCFNEVIIPWSNSSVSPPSEYPLEVAGRTFEATGYSLTASAGESRSGDAAGQHLRVLGGSGSNLVRFPDIAGRDDLFALTPFPILGAIPRVNDSRKTVFEPEEPCELADPPNLEAGIGSPPAQGPAPGRADLDDATGPGAKRLRTLLALTDRLARGKRVSPARLARAQRLVDSLGFGEVELDRLAEAAP